MEFLSAPWWSALMAIILIDLVLAGDNAIVIALAARNLPKQLQKKAIIWGTVGAITVRTAMTLVVVWLLKIPGLMLVGGLGLLWIAYKLIADQGGGEDEHGPAAGLEFEITRGGTRYRNAQEEIKVTTDANGEFSVTWPEAGMYWLETGTQDDRTTVPQAKQRRLSYVATLEVLPQ